MQRSPKFSNPKNFNFLSVKTKTRKLDKFHILSLTHTNSERPKRSKFEIYLDYKIAPHILFATYNSATSSNHLEIFWKFEAHFSVCPHFESACMWSNLAGGSVLNRKKAKSNLIFRKCAFVLAFSYSRCRTRPSVCMISMLWVRCVENKTELRKLYMNGRFWTWLWTVNFLPLTLNLFSISSTEHQRKRHKSPNLMCWQLSMKPACVENHRSGSCAT